MNRGHVEEVLEQKWALSEAETQVKQPRNYKVILFNDDYTPMDFVVEVLKRFFHLNQEVAVNVMLQVHEKGRGICGIFTYEIAETKVMLVNEYARSYEHPLLCGMEPE